MESPRPFPSQSQFDGFFQFEGLTGLVGDLGGAETLVGVIGLQRAASSGILSWDV
jgi:hypothetical protein